MNPYSPLWVQIERLMVGIIWSFDSSAKSRKEAWDVLFAMAKEQAEYDAWVNAEEARYREASKGVAPEKNETATEWLARMKKEGRI